MVKDVGGFLHRKHFAQDVCHLPPSSQQEAGTTLPSSQMSRQLWGGGELAEATPPSRGHLLNCAAFMTLSAQRPSCLCEDACGMMGGVWHAE